MMDELCPEASKANANNSAAAKMEKVRFRPLSLLQNTDAFQLYPGSDHVHRRGSRERLSHQLRIQIHSRKQSQQGSKYLPTNIQYQTAREQFGHETHEELINTAKPSRLIVMFVIP